MRLLPQNFDHEISVIFLEILTFSEAFPSKSVTFMTLVTETLVGNLRNDLAKARSEADEQRRLVEILREQFRSLSDAPCGRCSSTQPEKVAAEAVKTIVTDATTREEQDAHANRIANANLVGRQRVLINLTKTAQAVDERADASPRKRARLQRWGGASQ